MQLPSRWLFGIIKSAVDASMLWAAFHARSEVIGAQARAREDGPPFNRVGVGSGEGVCAVWTPRIYRQGLVDWGKPIARLVVMVYHKGTFERLAEAWQASDIKTLVGKTPYRPLVMGTPYGVEW